jgi:ATP-dependent protease ClpP protease subunit
MLHAVAGGSQGEIHDLENEVEEVRWIQEQYILSLVKETAMSKKYLTNLLKKKVNIYIGAEEAVELGIADEVV